MAYPRRLAFVCLFVFGNAILLEMLQIFIPDRDARIVDAVEKLAGRAAGISGASLFLSYARRRPWKI